MKVGGGARLIGNLDKQEEHRFLVMVIHNFAKKLGLPLPPSPLVLTPMVFWHDLKEFVKKTLLYE